MYKKVLDFQDKYRLLKIHLQQQNFFHFPQLTTQIVGKEIQGDKIPIALFSDIFDSVAGFCGSFLKFWHNFNNINTTAVAFPHLVETESAPLNLQMVLVEIKTMSSL